MRVFFAFQTTPFPYGLIKFLYTMKKLWISIGVALGLLGMSVPAYAQDATPARTSVKDYFFQSKVGNFVDLSTYNPDADDAKIALQFRVELGADLAKGTALKNVFFVGNETILSQIMSGISLSSSVHTLAMESEADQQGQTLLPLLQTVTVADDATERNYAAIPISMLGMESGLPFMGMNMQGLAVSALGGLLFADGSATDAHHLPTLSCDKAQTNLTVEKNLIHVYPTDLATNEILAPTKGDNAPVILALGSDDIGMFLWAQFDYMVGEARWLFQIRCYQNGRIDYITGNDLGQTALSADAKGYAFAPTVVAESRSNSLMLGVAYPDGNADPKPACWDLFRSQTTTSFGHKVTPDCGPESGRTLTLLPPFDAKAFSLTDPAIEAMQIEGKVILDPSKTSVLAAGLVNSICVSITTDEWKDYGDYGLPQDKEPETFKNDFNRVMFVGKPIDWTSSFEMPFTADELKPNTKYYIHVLIGQHTPGAYSAYAYSKPVKFGPYTTASLPAVTDAKATVADGKVNITFKPIDGLATMVVKSPNATPKTPTGNLAVGDRIGGSWELQDTVTAFLEAGTSTAELPIAAGEGFYLHLYAVNGQGTDNAVYSQSAATAVVYRPAESLPLSWTLSASSDPKALPIGWSHSDFAGSETAYADAAFAFRYVDTYVLTSRNENLVNGQMQADVILPAFISPEDNVTAVFNVKFYDFVDGWQYVAKTPAAGDSVRVDYRLDGGEWQAGELSVTFPDADKSTDIITLYATFSGTKDRLVEIRYTRYTTTANTANTIVSAQISREITCFPPKALTIDTAEVTDTQIALRWNDADNTTASYVIAYQESKTKQADTWETVPTTEKTVKLTGLKAHTAYRLQVQAVCAADDASAFSTPVTFSTYSGLPYTETLGEVVTDPTSPYTEWPSDRGVKTYTGKLGGEWQTETNATYTWSLNNSSSYKRGEDNSHAMGIHEDTKDAIMVSPQVYVGVPTKLTFTLNSFSAKKDEEYRPQVVPGATPTEADCKLMVAVSDNGEFTAEDVVLTLTGEELNVIDKDFELDVTKTGLLQIAFFFDNPATHWEDDFYIEAYDLGLRSAVAPLFDLTLRVTPENAGTVTGAGQYEEGSDVTITATPAEGYDFVAWMNGSAELSKEATYTFTMPAEDITYTAMFKAQPVELEDYELTLTASPANGGRVSGDGLYTEGEEVTISAEANKGFVFVAWLNADNDTLSKEATYTFNMPAKDTAFIARFVPETANEDLLRANFGISTQDGRLVIRNLDGMTVKSVDVYGLTGNRLNRFTPNSREDLTLPVDARRAMLFVRLETERGVVIYKVYMH